MRFNRLQGKSIQGITPEVLSLLVAYGWPGNIRELENTIERAFILCRTGYIGVEHLPEELVSPKGIRPATSELQGAHDLLDSQIFRAAPERHAYNRSKTAQELSIHKTTLPADFPLEKTLRLVELKVDTLV